MRRFFFFYYPSSCPFMYWIFFIRTMLCKFLVTWEIILILKLCQSIVMLYECHIIWRLFMYATFLLKQSKCHLLSVYVQCNVKCVVLTFSTDVIMQMFFKLFILLINFLTLCIYLFFSLLTLFQKHFILVKNLNRI